MQTNTLSYEKFTRTNKTDQAAKVHNKKDLTLERKKARNNKRHQWGLV